MTSEEAWSNCLLLLRVAPPLMFTMTSFQAMPINSLGYISTINLIWGIFASKISRLFLHHYVLFHLAQSFIHGNSRYLLPKCWNWQICHNHWAFKLPLRTVSGKLWTFPKVKLKTNGFRLDQTQQYTPVLFEKTPRELLLEKELLSGHYLEVAGTCYTTWCMWLHYVRFENCWKHLAEQLLVLQTCVSHHALVERGKDKTEHCC